MTGMGGGRRAAVAALLVSLGASIALMAESWPVTVDDAFISLRHARHWVEHGNPSFDASERIEAYSNFTWVALGAAVLRAGGDPVWSAKWLGALCALGSILLTPALAVRLGATGPFVCLGAALVALSSGLAFWAVSGMETALFTLLLTAGVWRLLGPGRRAPWSAAGLFLLASLTRLEGPILVGAAIAGNALARWREGLAPSRVLREHAWVAALAAGYALYFAWRWHYYGHLLPSPIYFKRVLAAGDVGASHGVAFLASSFPLLALAAAAPWLAGRRSWAPLAVVVAALVVFATARREVLGGVSTMAWLDRYFVPVLPCLAAAAVAALAGAARRLGAGAPRRAGVALVGAFLLLWQLGNPSANPAGLLARTRGYPEAVAARGALSAAHLQERLGAAGSVVAGDIGRLGYVFRGRVFDLYGLASYERTLHHRGALEPYLDSLLARAPDAILLCFDAVGSDPPEPCQPAEHAMTERPAFRAGYAVDAVFGREEVPRAYHVIYRRREAPPGRR